jgi:hypothetical protein
LEELLMAVVNEDTITLFLAKMSLDLNEQLHYHNHEKQYLEKVTKLSADKKAALISCDFTTINNAMLTEQQGVFQVISNIITYGPNPAVNEQLLRALRFQVLQLLKDKGKES